MLRRTAQLLAGTTILGLGVAAIVRADLGVDPLSVLVVGLARTAGITPGVANVVVGIALTALWAGLLGQRPGPASLLNPVVVGLALDAGLGAISTPATLAGRVALLAVGVLGAGGGAGLYLGARLGPGPFDGITTALAARGLPMWKATTVVLVAVAVPGVAMGGPLGPGTVAAVLGLGPVLHTVLAHCATPEDPAPPRGRAPRPAPVPAHR